MAEKGRGSQREKKRKRDTEGSLSQRKAAVQSSSKKLKISHQRREDNGGLLIANGSGITVPAKVNFQAYRRTEQTDATNEDRSNFLLQSSDHAKLNFTARPILGSGATKHRKHYVGILDPATDTLQLVEADLLSLQSTLRSEDDDVAARQDEEKATRATARRELGLEFGTKKAKKAISQGADNKVVSSEKQRAMSPQSLRKANPTASAVMDSVDASMQDAPTEEALQAENEEAKPRPKHDSSAERVEDVYPISQVVGEDMMLSLKVKPWVEAIQNEENVQVPSRFVAHRMKALVQVDNIRKLKVAKYIYVLLEVLKAGETKGKQGTRLPKREVLKEKLGVSDDVVGKLIERFTTNGKVTKWHVDLIKSTLAVLTLIIDDFETDTHDLREDLIMKPPEMATYFKQVGARLKPPSSVVSGKKNWNKNEAGRHDFAHLELPLQFPKPRFIPRNRR